ncbi:MAG: hypothetical protein GTN99_02780 [Candidatus Dadabacteria bacterium]|nr:hypothetical protein [Candidatus Dadabacteria bacterium]
MKYICAWGLMLLTINVGADNFDHVPVKKGEIYRELADQIYNIQSDQYMRIGDLMYNIKDGTTSARIGNTIYHSDGSEQTILDMGQFKLDLDNDITCYREICF